MDAHSYESGYRNCVLDVCKIVDWQRDQMRRRWGRRNHPLRTEWEEFLSRIESGMGENLEHLPGDET